MKSKEINLLVYDEKDHYDNHIKFLGESFFKSVNRVKSLLDLENILNDFKNDDLIFLIVHAFFTEGIKGIKEYKVSGIKDKYPKIGELYVSDGPRDILIEEMISKEMLDIEKIKPYFKIKTELSQEEFEVYSKKEIVNNNSASQSNPTEITTQKTGIFLSHSSKDKIIVEKFKELILRLGLEISDLKIKFTSSETPGIPAGINIPEDLKDFINNEMGLFIQFVSQDYLDSRTCLNEEGAAWCILNDINFISISLGKYGRAFTKESNKTINIDNEEQLQNIYEHRKQFFGNKNSVTLVKNINEFIENLPYK